MQWKNIPIVVYLASGAMAFRLPSSPRHIKPTETIIPGFHPQTYDKIPPTLPKYPEEDPLCEISYPPEPTPPTTPKFLVPGLALGVPLNLLTWMFLSQGMVDGSLTPQIAVLNCLVGTYTYGMDRMSDAAAWTGSPTSKAPLYQYIRENREVLKNIYDSIYWMFAMILMATPDGIRPQTLGFLAIFEAVKFSANLRYTFFSYYLGIYGWRLWAIYCALIAITTATHWFDHEFLYLPILAVLETTRYYPAIKKRWGWLKAPYVGAMWTGAIAVVPALIRDGSYHILSTAAPLVPFLVMTALSNMADIKDITEDSLNGIETLPVLLGRYRAILVSIQLCLGAYYFWEEASKMIP